MTAQLRSLPVKTIDPETLYQQTFEACVDLEMRMSEIVNELRSVKYDGLVNTFQRVAMMLREAHHRGNAKATKIIQAWNELSGTQIKM